MATFIGTETGGVLGALVATLGMILPSLLIIMAIAAFFQKALKHPLTQSALGAIKPVIMALIATTILFLLKNLLFPTNAIYSLETIDLRHLVLLINLATLYFGYRKLRKKPLHPMILIGVSAFLGILIFSF